MNPTQQAWLSDRLDNVENLLIRILQLTRKELNKMGALDDAIAALTTTVANEETVAGSATALINGIPGMITNAVNAALASGATPAQLQAINDLGAALTAGAAPLAAAVAANTPAAPGA